MLYDNETFTRGGYTFRVTFPHDESMGEPWKEHDGHGIISDWTHRDIEPGEWVLAEDGGARRYYDFDATLAIAKKDGWGVKRPGTDGTGPDDYLPLPHETAKAHLARAVNADFERMQAWCTDQWSWIGVCVVLLDEDGHETKERESLWGIESDGGEYLTEVAEECADQILARVEVETPDVVLSEN